MTLGEKITEQRKKAALSQEELGFQLNVTRQSVSLWETDQAQPSLDNLINLSKIFGISLDELCGNDELKEDEPKEDTLENSLENADAPKEDSKKESALYTASAEYNRPAIERAYKSFFKKNIIANILAHIGIMLSSLTITINILQKVADKAYVIMPTIILLTYSIMIITSLFRLIKKNTSSSMRLRPNLKSYYYFYSDRFVNESTSDNSNSTISIKYSEITDLKQDNEYIYVRFEGMFAIIDKSTCTENADAIFALLNYKQSSSELKKNNSKLKKSVRVGLIALFVLTLLSIFIALIAFGIVIMLYPYPQLSYAMIENTWAFYLVLPIPIASIVLGTVFLRKGYRCKKNIIGGAIMAVIIFLYGSFSLFSIGSVSHDYSYLTELSEQTNISFPANGSITIYKEDRSTYGYQTAMAKFDDDGAEEFLNYIRSDDNWKNDTLFVPRDAIDHYSILNTLDYEYFTVYNVTKNAFNDFDGQLIYLAYDIDENMLYVNCYK